MQSQNTNDQLSIILKNVLEPNQNIRQTAENQLKALLSQNFGQFLIELSKKIATEEEEANVRQVSSTLIKNSIIQYAEEWFKLQDDIKKIIKDNILSTLASKDINIKKAAALSIAGICKIEIPKGQWLNIFDILINTSQNNDINIQLSSLTTLEYIYEEIKQGDIPNEIVAKLLNTYYSLLTKDIISPQLAINTLNSILKFLPFIKDFISDSTSRVKLYDLIEKYVESDNSDIRKVGLQIFIEICRVYYDSLQDYIEKIFNFTKVIIEKDIESNKILSLELWRTIGEIENYRLNVINKLKKPTQNILQRYYQPLGEICLKYIVTEDYDNEEDSLSKACSDVIALMSRCCQYNFLSNMINYIGENIKNPSEKFKYSALNVFGSIICTIHKNAFYHIVKDSLNMVSETLLDNNTPSHFKKLCANIIKSITKNYSEELINDTIYFEKMIALYLQLFKISTKEVLYILIVSLNYLCKKVDWAENDQTNILSKYMQTLCEPLIKICSNTDYYSPDNNIAFVSFILLGTLGERAANDVSIQMKNIFKLLAQMFENTFNENNFKNDEMRYRYQEYISSSLSGFLMTGMADKNSAAKLLQCVVNSFEKRNDLYDEGISLIGYISLYTQNDFNAVMDVVSKYLIKGLQSHNSPSICKSSIFCLSDIIRALQNQNAYIDIYLPLILNILSDNNIDQTLKPFCFNIISDIFIYCPNAVFKHFNNIMKVIGEAMGATQIKFDENSDQDTFEYFSKLREHLLETITCIFHAIKDINKTNDFTPYVNDIVKYINFIGNDYSCPTNIMVSGLFIIGDFCEAYKEKMKPLLDVNLIKNMFTQIENDKEAENDSITKSGINWAKSIINNIYIN
jgi:importin subunit beta-1